MVESEYQPKKAMEKSMEWLLLQNAYTTKVCRLSFAYIITVYLLLFSENQHSTLLIYWSGMSAPKMIWKFAVTRPSRPSSLKPAPMETT